jgi:transcriptional regulator with PAS, ATPase and Fis domain
MQNHKWMESINPSMMVTDIDGVVIDMNEAAATTFADDGGWAIMGKNITECHTAHSNEIIQRLLQNGETNVYTIEKHGKKKLIYQTPWFNAEGNVGGLVEISLVLPKDMPHFKRD